MWSNFSFAVLNIFWPLSRLRHWKKYPQKKKYEICNSHYLMWHSRYPSYQQWWRKTGKSTCCFADKYSLLPCLAYQTSNEWQHLVVLEMTTDRPPWTSPRAGLSSLGKLLQAIKNPDQTCVPQGPKSQFAALVKVWSPQVQFILSASNPGPKLVLQENPW